ncbi:MAG: NlpC/P60 family protein [Oscillibacter sp.]
MNHLTGNAAKVLILSLTMSLLLAVTAMAADESAAIAVGATTGSSLRMRADASTSSSVVTTLDKGVAVAILDASQEDWLQISYDGKTGFVSSEYLAVDQDNVFTAMGRINADAVCVRSAARVDSELLATMDKDVIVTVNGLENGWYDVTCKYGTEGHIRSDFLDLTTDTGSASGSAMVDSARQHLGTRYVYGGSSPSGFDCSGFTMYISQQYGVSLPHTATGQWKSGKGTQIWAISALEPGDLVFFCDPSRSLGKACSHAGIYVGNGQFIHASSSKCGVIYSDLTSGYYNTYYVGGLRIL